MIDREDGKEQILNVTSYVFLTKCLAITQDHHEIETSWKKNIIFRKVRVPKSSQPIKGTYYHLHFTERSFGLHDTPNMNPLAIFTLKQNLPTCCWNTIQKGKSVDLY